MVTVLVLLKPTAKSDENVLSVKVCPDPTNFSGFFIIPTWANFVSIGKSLVESSNLAYNNTLSVPNSVYTSYPCPLDGGIIGINFDPDPEFVLKSIIP